MFQKAFSSERALHNWGISLFYIVMLAITTWRHELWGDELHSWNIAKASTSISELFYNIRYEGHPPLWYILLYVLSRFTVDTGYVQLLHFVLASSALGVLVFQSGFRTWQKFLIVSGYFFLYEYGAFSRNYSSAILFACIACARFVNLRSSFSWKYYALLFLLANTHVLGLFLALSFHLYALYSGNGTQRLNTHRIKHLLMGLFLISIPLYLIFPPNSSGLNVQFWIHVWSKDQLYAILQAPVKAFVSIPAWWNYHFWNSNALIELQKSVSFFKYVNPLLSLGIILTALYVLRPSRGALFFFCCNVLFTMVFALIFPLTSARYVGFIFVSFILSLWLAGEEVRAVKKRRHLITFLLVLQLPGTCVSLYYDWKFPFSSFDKVPKLYAGIPDKSEIVTDYWCLNYIVPIINKPVHCVGLNEPREFLLWTSQLTAVQKSSDLYSKGFDSYFSEHPATGTIYFFTTFSFDELQHRDQDLSRKFNLRLLGSETDALEKYSKIFLFDVRAQIMPGEDRSQK